MANKNLFILLLLVLSCSLSARTVDSTLNSMSIDEKIGQMIIVYHSPLFFLKKYNIGGTLVMSNMITDTNTFRSKIESINQSMNIVPFISIDQEGGQINRVNKIPHWKRTPSASDLSSWKPINVFKYERKIGQLLNSLGINVNLAPVMDPQFSFENKPTLMCKSRRAFGDSADSSLYAYLLAFNSVNIATTAKHFPGYDSPDNSDHTVSYSNISKERLEQYIDRFKQFSNSYQFIMMSSIVYRKISSKPAVFSKDIVSMARELNPNIIITTDDLWGRALRSYVYNGPNMSNKSYPDWAFEKIAQLSFLAGNDMLMITYPAKVPIIINGIKKLIKEDPTLIESLNSSVKRILLLKEKLGLIN